MEEEKLFIASTDWTKNWQASISAKITAITLWPTVIITLIVAYSFLYDLEEKIIHGNQNAAATIAYNVSVALSENDSLTFYEQLEKLRNDYHDLNLQGFELTYQKQIYRVAEFKHHKSYIVFLTILVFRIFLPKLILCKRR